VQPDVYCRKLGLAIPRLGAGPLNVSVRLDEVAELYPLLLSIAMDPRGAVPAQAGSLGSVRLRWRTSAAVLAALCGATGLSWFLWRTLMRSGRLPWLRWDGL